MSALYAVFLIFLFPLLNAVSAVLVSHLTGAEEHCLRTLALDDNPISCIDTVFAFAYGMASFFPGLFIVPLLCLGYEAKLNSLRARMWWVFFGLAAVLAALAVGIVVAGLNSEVTLLVGPLAIAICITAFLLPIPKHVGTLLTSCLRPTPSARP